MAFLGEEIQTNGQRSVQMQIEAQSLDVGIVKIKETSIPQLENEKSASIPSSERITSSVMMMLSSVMMMLLL